MPDLGRRESGPARVSPQHTRLGVGVSEVPGHVDQGSPCQALARLAFHHGYGGDRDGHLRPGVTVGGAEGLQVDERVQGARRRSARVVRKSGAVLWWAVPPNAWPTGRRGSEVGRRRWSPTSRTGRAWTSSSTSCVPPPAPRRTAHAAVSSTRTSPQPTTFDSIAVGRASITATLRAAPPSGPAIRAHVARRTARVAVRHPGPRHGRQQYPRPPNRRGGLKRL